MNIIIDLGMHIIQSPKELFLLEDGITYLNCSYMSPMLKTVKQAGLVALDKRAQPWNLTVEDWFTKAETLRQLVANIFQTANDNIALIPSASYGLSLAAKNIKLTAGKNILVLEHQYPSNYYAWENLAKEQSLQIVTIRSSADKSLTQSILENINEHTGLVAIPNCHWISGAWIDLEKISKAVKEVDALLVLDLSQSLGVLPIDIEQIQPDFAVSVGYKWMLGPYSLGYMYVAEKWQESSEPLEYSWQPRKGSENFADLTNYVTEYKKGARKFDMGEVSHINLMPMALAALEQINKWDIADVQQEIKKLTDIIVDYKISNGTYNENQLNAGHIISIPLKDKNINELKQRLTDNNVIVSFRSTSIRVSPHIYNSEQDIKKLLSCLDEDS
ncbi:MAG: aminotransferase class V-fold PLP-dependent enzyme [Ginsengibacter sp.]